MADYVDCRRSLLKNQISDQRLVVAILRSHVDECDFAVNWRESLYLNSNRTRDFASYHLLICGFHLNRSS